MAVASHIASTISRRFTRPVLLSIVLITVTLTFYSWYDTQLHEYVTGQTSQQPLNPNQPLHSFPKMNGNNGAFGNLEIGPVISVEMQPSLPASSEKSNENTEKQPHQEDDKKTESTSNSETSINDSESKQESTPKEPTEALSPQALESSALVEAAKSAANEEIDWSKFAYIQYVTNALYLCNSVMIFEQLHRFNVKADKVLLYPKAWDDHGFIGVAKAQLLKKNRKKQTGDFKTDHDLTSENKDQPQENVQESTNPENSKIQKRGRFEGSFKDIEIAGHVLEMLELLRSEYGVKTKPIDIIHVESEEETWAESFTKFLIFDQTEYDRVLFMDSDGVVLKSMDELFLTKSAKIAATRAYWLDPDSIPEDNKHGEQVDKSWMTINAQWELVEPSNDTFGAITSYLQEKHPDNGETVDNDSKSKEYDMDIFNKLFKDDTVILPHRNIMMLSGELRGKRDKHLKYLGPDENWDVDHVMSSIAYIHFSDWPFPKPWIKASNDEILESQPDCHPKAEGDQSDKPDEDCSERVYWNNMYKDFETRRKEVCQMPMIVPEEGTGTLKFAEPLAWE